MKPAIRLRLGIGLWFLSWLPLPPLILATGQHYGLWSTPQAASHFLVVAWTIQITIGLFIAGKEAIGLVKESGFKAVPGKVWHIMFSKTSN
jgi:hypothetical protein